MGLLISQAELALRLPTTLIQPPAAPPPPPDPRVTAMRRSQRGQKDTRERHEDDARQTPGPPRRFRQHVDTLA